AAPFSTPPVLGTVSAAMLMSCGAPGASTGPAFAAVTYRPSASALAVVNMAKCGLIGCSFQVLDWGSLQRNHAFAGSLGGSRSGHEINLERSPRFRPVEAKARHLALGRGL